MIWTAHTVNPTGFNLSRWFAVVALLTITLISVAMGGLLDRFITQRLLWQEAVLTKEFVQSLVQADKSLQSFLADPSQGLDADAEVGLSHIAALPDMLRANVYDPSAASSGRATASSSAATSVPTTNWKARWPAMW